jgi:starch-binding outer membrane protein, SusD/RagB family
MNKSIYILYVSFSLLLFSCSKYLEKKTDKSLSEPSSLKDLQAMLDHGSIMNDQAPSSGEASSDNHYLPIASFNSMDEMSRRAYVWENYEYSSYPNDWSYLYDVVNVANICLEKVETIERTSLNSSNWGNIKGSALFFRAQSFLSGVWAFCKAYDVNTSNQDYGMTLRLTPDFNMPSTRATIAESYDRIIRDLKDALPLLPATPTHVMRPSQGAAYGLLARTYLSMRIYDSAYKYADLCLQLKSDLMDFKTMSNLTGTSSPFIRTNPEIIFSNISSVYMFLGVAPATGRVDTTLYNSYNDADLRKKAYFRSLAPGFSFKGSYSGSRSLLFVGLATDEMFFIKAECAARLGKRDEALTILNKVMLNRWDKTFIPFTSSSAEEALSIILRERRKELIYRDLRWIDIKRLNKEGANIVLTRKIEQQIYQLSPNENRYALPLPSPIVSLTGMPQNPK